MARTLREGLGFLLVVGGLVTAFYAVVQLNSHDYVAAILLIMTGLPILRAGLELLRPLIGE